LILAWLIGLAGAQEPPPTPRDPVWIDAHGTLLLDGAGGVAPGLGAGVGVGRAPVVFELRTDLSGVADGPRLALWPALRLHLVDVHRPGRWRPSVHGGLGLRAGVQGDPVRLLVVGADLDTDHPFGPLSSERLRPRLGAWTESDLSGAWSVGIKLGVVVAAGGRGAPAEPDAPVDPDAPDADQAPSGADGTAEPGDGASDAADGADGADGADATDAADAVADGAQDSASLEGPWWDPQACEWVDEDPGNGWRPVDGVGVPGQRAADEGSEGAQVGPGRQGWLVVVAEPGAVVRLPGIDQSVGSEGAVRLAAPEGVVDVEVVGGGRTQTFEAAVADGFVLWLRASPPDEVAVQFDSGSAAIDEADRVAAQALARNRGQYRLQLTGSYSPEGNRAQNLDLARRRAQAVRALLEEVGVPAEDLEVLPPTPPREGLSAAQQRAVYITPVSPQEVP